MNPNYNQTITIYNCLKAKDNVEGKDIWQKTVIENCFYKAHTSEVQNGTDISKANTYTVRIRKHEKYLPYGEWKNLSSEEREGSFTISKGDMVIKGSCQEKIELKSPNTVAQILLRNKPDAFMVTAFADNTNHVVGKHYRIGG